jgi:lysophospholipase L1-like esterase
MVFNLHPSTQVKGIKMVKRVCFSAIGLAWACFLAPAFGADNTNEPALPPGANTAAFPAPHADRQGDVQRKLDRFGGKHFDIVFDGDSIMNRWETTGKAVWNQRYAGIAADFGIEGDRVENVLWRLDKGQVDGIDPKVVVLMIGTNNSGQNSADQIAEGIKILVAEYEKRCPHAHIILMGIFPRGEKPTDGGRLKVAAVNSQIKALDDGQRVTFIDIGAQLIEPDGMISRDMMPDFVHPTAKGYQIWADAIQPVINKYVPSKMNKPE